MCNMQKQMLRELSAPWYPLSYRSAESSPETAARIDRRRFLIRLGGATAIITVAGAVAGALVAGTRSREVIGIKPFLALLARPERQKFARGARHIFSEFPGPAFCPLGKSARRRRSIVPLPDLRHGALPDLCHDVDMRVHQLGDVVMDRKTQHNRNLRRVQLVVVLDPAG